MSHEGMSYEWGCFRTRVAIIVGGWLRWVCLGRYHGSERRRVFSPRTPQESA